MDDPIVVGIDIGTTKICTLVGKVEPERNIRILGVGVEPSQGIRKGTIVDLGAASESIARSIDKAQRTSGYEISSALISMAGSQISSQNNRGVVGISGQVITEDDVLRGLESARAVAIPHNREIIHVIQRGSTVDGQDGIRTPIGMHGYRLEVEAHIITAAEAAVENLKQCVQATGVQISQIVLNSLASAEVSLSENERQMGVAICDIGGGTSDLAIYLDGDVWHTSELAIGGNHITSDIAQGLRIPVTQAEEIKRQYGYAIEGDISPDDTFTTRGFGNDQPQQVSRADLSHIIEARVEEIFEMLLQEIRRSGYDGLLPAGLVLTGGTSSLPGIRNLASRVLRLPVRVAMPDNLHGLVDQLNSPAFSTSIGLLHWALHMSEITPQKEKVTRKSEGSFDWQPIKVFLRRLLP